MQCNQTEISSFKSCISSVFRLVLKLLTHATVPTEKSGPRGVIIIFIFIPIRSHVKDFVHNSKALLLRPLVKEIVDAVGTVFPTFLRLSSKKQWKLSEYYTDFQSKQNEYS